MEAKWQDETDFFVAVRSVTVVGLRPVRGLGGHAEERGWNDQQGREQAAAHAHDHGVLGGLGREHALEVALPGDAAGGEQQHHVEPFAPLVPGHGAEPVDRGDGGDSSVGCGEWKSDGLKKKF